MNAEKTAMRLQETAAKCLSSLDAWNKDLNNFEARENLLEAVHELRKVTSRLEIDIAMNDQRAANAKTIPIPEHKSKTEKRKQKPLSDILPVAEIKESNRRKKIEIAAANDMDDDDDYQDDDDGNDDGQQPETNEAPGDEKPKKKVQQRRPRRQKRDDKGNSSN